MHGDDYFLIFDILRQDIQRPDSERISGNFIKMLEDFAVSEKGELAFADCTFQDNVGSEDFNLVSITRDGCENKQFSQLP